MCVSAGVHSLCLHSLVRLARVNGVLKGAFSGEPVNYTGLTGDLAIHITCVRTRSQGIAEHF